MAEKYELATGDIKTIRSFVMSNMLKGAGWAALLVVGWLVFIYALVVISWLLPVNPNAALDNGATLISAIV